MTLLGDGQEQLLRALLTHDVEFVVVGGVAAQLHGWQSATLDLDISIAVNDTNVQRLDAALAAVGARQWAQGAFGTAFTTRFGRLEIVRRAHAVGDYAGWRERAVRVEAAPGLVVVVAHPNDILRSKQAAGRDKDRAVLAEMRRDFIESGALDADEHPA